METTVFFVLALNGRREEEQEVLEGDFLFF